MQRIGFIGLGVMGKPMAANLLKAGFEVVAHNRSQAPVDALVAQGAERGTSPADVARRSDVIITMLPDTPDVERVVTGPEGLLEALRPGHIYIDMSTISPVVTRQLAEKVAARGAEMLDAPVSGGDKGAIAGTLSIMVGGKAEVFERCRPIFEAMGKTIVHVGDVGAGQTVKACNQIVVALTLEAIAEALVLGTKAGVDPAKIIQVLNGGFASSRVLEVRGPDILKRNFKPGFRSALHHKDLGIAIETGRAFQVPLLATGLVHQLFGALTALGRGDNDHSALITLLEDWAGVEVKGSL